MVRYSSEPSGRTPRYRIIPDTRTNLLIDEHTRETGDLKYSIREEELHEDKGTHSKVQYSSNLL